MVGLSHYSPSTDMLPRVIWQLVKINHNQEGCRHCHGENVALEADRVWEQKSSGQSRTPRKANRGEAIKIPCAPHGAPKGHAFERTHVSVSPQQVRRKTDGRNVPSKEKEAESAGSSWEEGGKRPDAGAWEGAVFSGSCVLGELSDGAFCRRPSAEVLLRYLGLF